MSGTTSRVPRNSLSVVRSDPIESSISFLNIYRSITYTSEPSYGVMGSSRAFLPFAVPSPILMVYAYLYAGIERSRSSA